MVREGENVVHQEPLTRLTRLLSCSVVDLASVCTPEMMAPILTNAEVQQRLLPFLPSGESLPQSAEEIQNTLNSPQFQQVGRTHRHKERSRATNKP